MFFSKTTNGFYDVNLKESYGDSWPKDALEISDELYHNLLDGQTQGKVISSDKKGNPILVEPPVQAAIIPTITKRQAMLQLDEIGLYDDLIEFINQSENKKLKIEFEYSSSFERDSPVIIGMAQQFSLTDEQVDNLFIEAAKL